MLVFHLKLTMSENLIFFGKTVGNLIFPVIRLHFGQFFKKARFEVILVSSAANTLGTNDAPILCESSVGTVLLRRDNFRAA
jgi:hypothetical protein